MPFGAFVQVGDGIEGLVHISEMAAQHVEAPEQVVTPGEELWVKIIDIDLDRRRISLSIKQAAEGGEVAAEYQDQFGEHAYDEHGNYIGPEIEVEVEAEADGEVEAERRGRGREPRSRPTRPARPFRSGRPTRPPEAVAEPPTRLPRSPQRSSRRSSALKVLPLHADESGVPTRWDGSDSRSETVGNRRTLLAAAAILLAAAAGMGVYFYVSGADKRAEDKVQTVEAFVAVRDIPKGTSGSAALAEGLIAPARVLRGSVPAGRGDRHERPDQGKVAAATIQAKQYITDASFVAAGRGRWRHARRRRSATRTWSR